MCADDENTETQLQEFLASCECMNYLMQLKTRLDLNALP